MGAFLFRQQTTIHDISLVIVHNKKTQPSTSRINLPRQALRIGRSIPCCAIGWCGGGRSRARVAIGLGFVAKAKKKWCRVLEPCKQNLLR